MVREISEHALSRPNRSLAIATIGALALALTLAGCGRKGALDPPPGGYYDGDAARAPATGRGGAPAAREQQPEYDEDGRPIVSKGPKRRLPVDWLID
jgi:predicted small lipoprotein YifL